MRSSTNICITLFIAFLMTTGCSNSRSTDRILKDKKKSEAIMSLISHDSAMTDEMINHIVLNKKANQQFRNVMKSMMTKDFLMELMQGDSILTNDVMCSVLEMASKNEGACRQMEQTIEKYNLKEKLGIDLTDKKIIEKDKVQVQQHLKIPPLKRSIR